MMLFVAFLSLNCAEPPKDVGLMREGFWGKGENADLPRAFESVCVEPPECGGTHFSSDRFEYHVNYTKFESDALAEAQLEKKRNGTSTIVRESMILDPSGIVVGKKMVLIGVNSDGERLFTLAWTRRARFATVTADSIDAIAAYENDRNL